MKSQEKGGNIEFGLLLKAPWTAFDELRRRKADLVVMDDGNLRGEDGKVYERIKSEILKLRLNIAFWLSVALGGAIAGGYILADSNTSLPEGNIPSEASRRRMESAMKTVIEGGFFPADEMRRLIQSWEKDASSSEIYESLHIFAKGLPQDSPLRDFLRQRGKIKIQQEMVDSRQLANKSEQFNVDALSHLPGNVDDKVGAWYRDNGVPFFDEKTNTLYIPVVERLGIYKLGALRQDLFDLALANAYKFVENKIILFDETVFNAFSLEELRGRDLGNLSFKTVVALLGGIVSPHIPKLIEDNIPRSPGEVVIASVYARRLAIFLLANFMRDKPEFSSARPALNYIVNNPNVIE